MRILFHHRIASADGQFVHLTELVKALRGLGHEVLVVGPAITEDAQLGSSSAFVGALKKRVPKALYEVLELGYSAVAAARLWAAARRFRPDCIYERYNLHLHAGAWVAALLRLPLLLEVNSPLTEERARYGGLALRGMAAWSDRRIWRAADYVLPVTRVLAGFVERAGVPADRIRVIPNGADMGVYRQLPAREQAKAELGLSGFTVLGFTGFVRSWHGMAQILDYAAQHRELPLCVLVVGDGDERTELEAQARRLGIADRLRFTGFVPREQVPRYVAAFDIALQPAVTEYASPLKLFEYMAAGCAIVAPDAPNIREVLADGRNALLNETGNFPALVGSIDRLLRDPQLRQTLGSQARADVVSVPYTWEHNARTVVTLAASVSRNAGSAQPVPRP